MAREKSYKPIDDIAEVQLRLLLDKHGQKGVMDALQREVALRDRQRELVRDGLKSTERMSLVAQKYEAAVKAYRVFGIVNVPSWLDVRAQLSPIKRAFIEKLPDVRVLLPGGTRYEMVAAINKKVGHHGITSEVSTCDISDDTLWSNGQAETVNKRQLVFVDGREEVPYNEALQAGKTNHEQVVALKTDYYKQGFDVLTGAQGFLGLQMQALADGKLIDKDNWTVLNPDVVANDERAVLGRGGWSGDRVVLRNASPRDQYGDLRLRAAVIVNL